MKIRRKDNMLKILKNMKVNIKKLKDNAVIPHYAHDTDAGLDLVATSIERDEYGNFVCHTGLAIEIPKGYVGYLFPRSSVSKYKVSLCNSVGVIDSGYRGEIILKFNNLYRTREEAKSTVATRYKNEYQEGDKVGQLIIMPYPKIELVEVDELTETDRGDGGFGSSGK